ncbi:MAG: putative HAF family extracellular repeat protein [Gammaproteobacteria bacterium]|jgi:probable HAF family extracellular repeat protein
MRASIIFALALSVVAPTTHASVVGFDFVEIAPLPGDDKTQVFGINNLGQVIGDSLLQSGGYSRGFLWTNGVSVDLGFLPGNELYAQARAVNDLGQVVGQSNGQAFLWDSGTMTAIASNDSNNVTGIAINNSSQVVINLGLLWENGSLISAGMRFSQDINESSVVAGHNTGPTVRGAIYDGNSLTVVNNLPDETDPGFGLRFYAINDVGQAVGHRSKNGRSELFFWENGAIVDLGNLESCVPYDINRIGQVVGDCASGAFLWDMENGLRYLNDLVDMPGVLVTATGINDSGQIVAYGSNGAFERGFLRNRPNAHLVYARRSRVKTAPLFTQTEQWFDGTTEQARSGPHVRPVALGIRRANSEWTESTSLLSCA